MVAKAVLSLLHRVPIAVASGDVAAGSGDAAGGGLSTLFDTGLKVADFAFDLFDIMIAHPILSIFVAVGLLSLAAGLIGRFSGVAKSVG